MGQFLVSGVTEVLSSFCSSRDERNCRGRLSDLLSMGCI